MIRLLFLTAEHWPTFRADVAVLFGKWLPQFGVQAHLVTLADPAGGTAWQGGPATLATVRGGQARRRAAALWHGLRTVVRVRRGEVDAVQVRDMPVLAALALAVARVKRLPFYYWMSYPMPEGQIALARQRGLSAGWMKFLYPWVSGHVGRLLLYRVVLRLADHVFVQSPRMADDMAARGVPRERMTPVPMGVDFDAVDVDAVAPADDPALQGRRVVVYLGTLDRPRQIERLFDMLALVRQQVPDVLLVLAGDTEDAVHRDWLKAQARDKGVADDVYWTGWLPTHQAWRYLRRAELGLSPIPRGELLDMGSPTKLPEYLMFRLPVLCNDNPDQAALLADCGAGLCVPYTAEQFAVACEKLLAITPSQRQALGAAGRAHVGQARNYAAIASSLATRYGALLRQQTIAGDAVTTTYSPPQD